MIIARGENNDKDRKTLLLGLSHENVARLLKGQPIHIKRHDALPDDIELLIMVGRTDEEIKKELEGCGVVNDLTNIIRDDTNR